MHLTSRFRPLPLAYRLLCVGLIVCFAIVGLIGLILPIIPGIVFLLLALYLLTRVSRRVANYMHRQPWYHQRMRDFSAASKLSWTGKIRLSLLVLARGVVDAIRALLSFRTR